MTFRSKNNLSRVGEFDTLKERDEFYRDEWWCEAIQKFTTTPPDKWPTEWRRTTERK